MGGGEATESRNLGRENAAGLFVVVRVYPLGIESRSSVHGVRA